MAGGRVVTRPEGEDASSLPPGPVAVVSQRGPRGPQGPPGLDLSTEVEALQEDVAEVLDTRLPAVELSQVTQDTAIAARPVIDPTLTPADRQMLAYVTATGKFIYRDPFFIDPADGFWGPVTANASTDVRATFQKAINFAIMGNEVDPALAGAGPIATRYAKWPIKLRAGYWGLDAKLKIYSVHGLRFEGSGGLGACEFRPRQPGMDYLIDFNGCGSCHFSDFAAGTGVDGGSGEGTVQAAWNIDAITAVGKNSGPYNLFRNVCVGGNVKCIDGFRIGASGTSNAQDCYHNRYEHCHAFGFQRKPVDFTATTTNASNILTAVSSIASLANGDPISGRNIPAGTTITDVNFAAGQVQMSANATASIVGNTIQRGGWDTATWWQNGFKVGHEAGALGNVLHHVFEGCTANGWVRGVRYSATSVMWRGGVLQANGTDIYNGGGALNCPCVFEGFRSEISGRLLGGSNAGAATMLTLRDIGFHGRYLASDNIWIRFNYGGQFVMENVMIFGQPAGRQQQPLVNIGSGWGSVVHIKGLTIETIDGNPNPKMWLVDGAPRVTTWVVEDVVATLIGGGGTGEEKPLRGPISNRDRIAPILSFSATATSGSAVLASGSSVASAQVRVGQTVVGPNIPAGTTVLSVSGNNITMSANATGSGAATHALTTYTVHGSDKYVGIAGTLAGSPATITLPSIAAVTAGHEIVFKDESGTAGTTNVTVQRAGANTIEGATTKVINTNYGGFTLRSTGTEWVAT